MRALGSIVFVNSLNCINYYIRGLENQKSNWLTNSTIYFDLIFCKCVEPRPVSQEFRDTQITE